MTSRSKNNQSSCKSGGDNVTSPEERPCWPSSTLLFARAVRCYFALWSIIELAIASYVALLFFLSVRCGMLYPIKKQWKLYPRHQTGLSLLNAWLSVLSAHGNGRGMESQWTTYQPFVSSSTLPLYLSKFTPSSPQSKSCEETVHTTGIAIHAILMEKASDRASFMCPRMQRHKHSCKCKPRALMLVLMPTVSSA